ncbi:unnamed protein product [Rotaria socialis]|uniref:TLDc domain-containing protein n=2 Tax=Rotaria TaxID=231623 RepID=A0A820WR40_9BILA|nr:unnamed protein product [Rotaria socialis]CAF3421224.1 unnamed protein product [Rotaria socialis]CAF3464415.1 unnamed protein product [Rotaria socialis]CAF3476098.1 unnamed protein product [Rotaria socialis]CAF4411030.1 unnamed protein product [Rotaria socialis]
MAEQPEKNNSILNTLRDNVNQLETRFVKIREETISKLNECSECIKSAKQLCHEATEMTTVLENKLVNASNDEKEWKDIKVKLATTSIQGMVILNVGGDRYTTSIETLTREKNTFFTALFSKQWQLERDPDDKSIFIDRNGKIFTYILEYFRTNTVPNNVMKDETLLTGLLIEAEYFQLKDLLAVLPDTFPNGTLLKVQHKQKLNDFYGKTNQQWELIYKATRDGFDANTFHSRCNNKGPTITIIQSNNNYLFGGYTAIPWASESAFKTDTTAFLFTLTNPNNLPPTKYLINLAKQVYAVYHYGVHGPTFGYPHDINIANGSNANNTSCTNFPSTYLDTTGKGNNTFTGARNFTTSDIEVFKLA